ncbi:MAG TPA: hypothetical protein VG097_17665 [Gemmata sp.]|nr:hypothetical protein [Gemmata sp.]
MSPVPDAVVKPTLFVLVSTGQKVANLPPVLQHSQRGDFVLWVESNEARDRKWTDAPRSILEQRGLITAEVIEVEHVNDPALLAAALAPFSTKAIGQYERVFLVANGGPKLSPIGLMFGLEILHPQLLYGDVEPAVHCLYPYGLDSSPTVLPYGGQTLTLPEILHLTGHLIQNAGEAVQFWPDPHVIPKPCQEEPYGLNEEYTYRLHADHLAWADTVPTEKPVSYDRLHSLAPLHYDRWLRTIRHLREPRQLNPQDLKDLYNSTLNMDRQARIAIERLEQPRPAAPLGRSFERGVARRVREWLDAANHSAVQSAWCNVEVSKESNPRKSEVQFDILLVLKNGILIHLECKSAEIDVRDLDVRLYRLQRTASQLAQLAVVLPLFTRRCNDPWFRSLHSARIEVEKTGLPILPFTWPDQPQCYWIPNSDPPEESSCIPFETRIGQLLSRYLAR